MGVPLDIAERYVWTFLQYLRLCPRRFFAAQARQPDSFLRPAVFLGCNLGLFVTIHALDLQVWEQIVKHLPRPSPSQPVVVLTPGAAAQLGALYQVTVLVLSALLTRLYLWWPLRAKADLKMLLDGEFYSSALLVCFAAYSALGGLLLATWFSSSSDLLLRASIFLAASLFLAVIIVVPIFHLSTVTALTGVRARRLLQAGLIAGFGWLAVWLLIWSVFALLAGDWLPAVVLVSFSGILLALLTAGVRRLPAVVRREQNASGAVAAEMFSDSRNGTTREIQPDKT